MLFISLMRPKTIPGCEERTNLSCKRFIHISVFSSKRKYFILFKNIFLGIVGEHKAHSCDLPHKLVTSKLRLPTTPRATTVQPLFRIIPSWDDRPCNQNSPKTVYTVNIIGYTQGTLKKKTFKDQEGRWHLAHALVAWCCGVLAFSSVCDVKVFETFWSWYQPWSILNAPMPDVAVTLPRTFHTKKWIKELWIWGMKLKHFTKIRKH